MDFFKKKVPHFGQGLNPIYKKVLILGGFLIVIFLLIMFIIRPGVTGYIVYKDIKEANYSIENYQSELKDLEKELIVSQTNLTSCQTFYSSLLGEMEKYSTKNLECEGKLNSLQSSINSDQSEISDLNEKISEKESEYKELEENYGRLAENSAKTICCIEKQIKDLSINSYTIEGDKVICTTNGEKSISCS